MLIPAHEPCFILTIDGRRWTYRRNARGDICEQIDPHGQVTRYRHDTAGRLRQVLAADGATRTFSYNDYGKVSAEQDELGQVTRYEYDRHLHLISRRIDPDGSQLCFRHDRSSGLLSEIENQVGEVYRLERGADGRIEQERTFDGRRFTFAYDHQGHLLQKTQWATDGSALVTAYQRDRTGRLLLKTLPDAGRVAYQYDSQGRLARVDDDSDWPLTFTYDLSGRLLSEQQGWVCLHYVYNTSGQLERMQLPDNRWLDYHFALDGSLAAVDYNGERLSSHRFEHGQEQQREQGRLLSQYHYDAQGRLQVHTVNQPQRPLYLRHYSYGVNGNLASIADSRHGQRSFYYDAGNRLVRVRHSRGEQGQQLAYDPCGNRLPDPGHCRYDYDAFGNLIRVRRDGHLPHVTHYHYDCQHRLSAVVLPDGSRASYRYDPFGRRSAKTVDGSTVEFVWQGPRLVGEISADHHRDYLYEPDTFRPLALVEGGAAGDTGRFYYQLDHLGTPQELTDSRGEIVWAATYQAGGQIASLRHLGHEPMEQPLRFQGQYCDEETGLHYNRHRYYCPHLGRYLTPAPNRLAAGLNAYQYAVNPTAWVNPLGLSSCPGGDGRKPMLQVHDPLANAVVDEAEPQLPQALMRGSSERS